MSKTKENIVKWIALGICDLAGLLVMIYITYVLCVKQESISLSNFILLIVVLLYFCFYVLGIAELLIRGKDSVFFKSFKQAINLVFNKLLRTDFKID